MIWTDETNINLETKHATSSVMVEAVLWHEHIWLPLELGQ